MPNQSRSVMTPTLSIVFLIMGIFVSCALAQGDGNSQGEVQLGVASFGVGGTAREGDWTGIHVQLQDLGSSGRDIVLRISIRDSDGDETQYDRVVTANPGMPQSFWLYCWLPYRAANLEYELKAYEAIDSGNDDVGQFGFQVGKLLGTFPIYNPRIEASAVAIVGIVGTHKLSLDQYGFTTGGRLSMPFGHELIRTSSQLRVENLPDRWQGLLSLDTLVWSGASTAATTPGRLSPEKARAIRTWVERGGHLVIVLPTTGDPWYLGSHPLRSLLPEINMPRREEGVDLEQYRSLLTESATIPLPKNAVVHTFEPLADQASYLALPVLNGIDGQCVAIRRLVGSGMVTVVGLPLNHGQLRRVGLPEPESLWHRVLGLRGDILRPDQMDDQQKSDAGNRIGLVFDDNLGGAIAKSGRAVQGVFFGIVVFALYWIVAGPGGFALLRARKKKEHAWVAFVATTGIFTAIAWVGATSMRPKSTNISHLSMLEQVHGQDTQRVRSWMSAMLPSYGSAVVSLRDPERSNEFLVNDSTNLLSPWASPDSFGTLTQGFPDNSGYRVESKDPSAIRVPTRATVKSFLSEWSGQARWSMPAPIGEAGLLEEPKLTLDGTVVRGQLMHDLPGSLINMKVFVITGQKPILRVGESNKQRMMARASVYSTSIEWEPGQILNLEEITLPKANEKQNRRQLDYFTKAVKFGVDQSAISTSQSKLVDRLIAARFLSQLEPPRYGVENDPVGHRLAVRRMLHGWDLGRWFTQPTLIIMGVVDVEADQANTDGMPTPMWINGKEVPASGKTIVTWIYPFEAKPPSFMGVTKPKPKPTQSKPTQEKPTEQKPTTGD